MADFGSGSDGVFFDGPSQTGVSVNGTTITFDTTIKSIYQFSGFVLSQSYTLVATGANPLIILVNGNAVIAGTIRSNGATGSQSQSTSGAPSGGSGGAGGGAGGAAASLSDAVAITAVNGSPLSSPTRDGGKAGTNTATTPLRGGGGGCNSAGASASSAGLNNAGSAGSCGSSVSTVADTFDTSFLGGAGGAGGTARVSTVSGSGGGGAGGAIRLAAIGTLAFSGTLEVKGGAGGATEAGSSPYCGGGGGGGSGGSVWAQALGDFSGSGTVNIAGGAGGGTTSVACSGAEVPGGVGSSGVFRADHATGAPSWTVSNGTVNARSMAVLAGQTYTVVSRSIDYSRIVVEFSAAQETFKTTGSAFCGSAGTTSIVYEGSQDNVNWTTSVTAANLSQLNQFPYVRFKVTFNTAGGTPPCVSSIVMPAVYKDLPNLTIRGGPVFCATLTRPLTREERRAAYANMLLLLALVSLGWRVALHRNRQRS